MAFDKKITQRSSVEDVIEALSQPHPVPVPIDFPKWENCRHAHIHLLEQTILNCPPYPEEKYAGRGIVISVNAKPGMSSGKHLPNGYFPGAWCVLQELRRLGCTLPVCFAYLGDLELDPYLTRLVEPCGVTCIDLVERAKTDHMRILAGWESKVFAVQHAPFEQVLYLDADCIPVRDPSYLFDSPQLAHYGAIFWPDVPPHDRSEWLPDVCWTNVGLTPRPTYVDFETGQFAIDKRRWWPELIATRHINEHSDWYYKFVFGDKSTFHLAGAKVQDMLGRAGWAMPSHPVRGNHCLLEQHDFNGRLLFQHCTRNKPSLAGFPHPDRLIHRQECERHLARLREMWDGQLWSNPSPTPTELEIMDDLKRGTWRYERVGLGERPLRFLSDSTIGYGKAKCEIGWDVFEDTSGLGAKLIVKSLEGGVTFICRRVAADRWEGEWLEHERCKVILERQPQ